MDKPQGGRSDRRDLDFTAAAQEAFAFLLQQYSFQLTRAEPTFVRFESPIVGLQVYHGRQSYEVGVEVAWINDPSATPYRLQEVLGALADQTDEGQWYFQSSDKSGLRTAVQRVAQLVITHYQPLLIGDPAAFALVRDYAARSNLQYTKNLTQKPLREAAESAWLAHDYAKVVTVYTGIQDDLTIVECQRLAYARKHVKPSG